MCVSNLSKACPISAGLTVSVHILIINIARSPTGQWLVFRGMALAYPEMPMLATNKSEGHIEDSSLDYLEAVRLFILAAVFTDQTLIND